MRELTIVATSDYTTVIWRSLVATMVGVSKGRGGHGSRGEQNEKQEDKKDTHGQEMRAHERFGIRWVTFVPQHGIPRRTHLKECRNHTL